MRKPILWSLSVLAPFALLTACASAPQASSKESQVQSVVEEFGRRLQLVSVQSPNSEQDMRAQYSDLVSPGLLEQWINNLSMAPGRIVSSPWPDRIQIMSIEEVSDTSYSVTGDIVLITSTEVVNGGTADLIPVRLSLERVKDRWLITHFQQGAADP